MEVLACLRRCRVKGYHVFRAGGPGENFFGEREAHNLHSKAAIKVKLNTDGSVIGHIPDGLAAVLAPLLDSGTVTSVTGTITDPPRSAAEGVWAVGGGIELPCEYALHGAKKDRSHVRTALRRSQSTVKSRNRKRDVKTKSKVLLCLLSYYWGGGLPRWKVPHDYKYPTQSASRKCAISK